jgi:PIN domain nuclease of toxin-antitoxin system
VKVLLDTHIAIWAVSEPARLFQTERDVIGRADSGLYVSVVSLCEIAIKRTQGRSLYDPISLNVEEAVGLFNEADFDILPLLPTHTMELQRLPLLHKDPFDRLLVSQSRVENMVLLTRDRLVRNYLNEYT